jgi:CBS domain-containing protein
MRARDLARGHVSVRADDPAVEAGRVLASADVRAVLVLDGFDGFVGVLTDRALLRCLLPAYVQEVQALAGVLEERAAQLLWRRLEGKLVRDLLPEEPETLPVVEADDTLIQVASVMVRAGVPLVAARSGGRVVGAITIEALLAKLLRR